MLILCCSSDKPNRSDSEHSRQEREFGSMGNGSVHKVLTGLDVLVRDDFELLRGKRVGLVINHTSVDANGNHILNLIRWKKDVKVAAIFTPEHGFSGLVPAGESVSDGIEPRTGARIFSLYGDSKKPTPDMLKGLDCLVYDIQDVGSRFYTYIWTMSYCLEAAAESGISVIILDRPNPINGTDVSGPVLDENFASFIGRFPIPIRHGMTVGELAELFVGERWISEAEKIDLKIIKMQGWRRSDWMDNTTCPWIKPSPNMTDLETAIVYPGLCLFEGTNVSEGRGTDKPFLKIGAPFINAKTLSRELNKLNLPGVVFEPIYFTPKVIENVVLHPKYLNRPCQGVRLFVTRRMEFRPVETGIRMLSIIQRLFPEDFRFRESYFIDRLYGNDSLRLMILQGKSPEDIINRWQPELDSFKQLRAKYLLYQ